MEPTWVAASVSYVAPGNVSNKWNFYAGVVVMEPVLYFCNNAFVIGNLSCR